MFSGEKFLQFVTESISAKTCNLVESVECRDDGAAFILKMVAIVAILISGIFGVALPLIGKERKFLRTDGNLFFTAKAFAAGVILATGFVHMLSSGTTALSNPCLPETPWKKFPFSGFIAMMASLLTLLADFVATQFYERNQEKGSVAVSEDGLDESLLLSSDSEIGIAIQNQSSSFSGGKVFGEEQEGGGIHIVGIHAHAAHHSHSHLPGKSGCKGHVQKDAHAHSHVEKDAHGHSHGHSHSFEDGDDVEGSVRHVIVSQILELGIVSHSMIIGLSLGVSHSPCTIRPLIAALSFHQFFEGFALGGCISQALLKRASTIVMACFFAVTTPAGIAMGTGIASLYNPNSPRALAIEGILDSISAGILIYMALVDLIAADFLSKRIRCDAKLQIMSYIALFLGAGSMSLLAIWA